VGNLLWGVTLYEYRQGYCYLWHCFLLNQLPTQPLYILHPIVYFSFSISISVMVNSVPDIPGEQAPPEIQQQLSVLLSKLCGVPGHRPRFPGSQPISFTAEHLQLLEKKDFWVCEKSDGLRLLIYILMNGNGQQEVWLVSWFWWWFLWRSPGS
jgi:hypothetical protein